MKKLRNVNANGNIHYQFLRDWYACGMHDRTQAGISTKKSKCGNLVVSSIVLGDRFDDVILPDGTIVYSGDTGYGKHTGGNKKIVQIDDQKWSRNNLAFKEAMNVNSPIRIFKVTRDGVKTDYELLPNNYYVYEWNEGISSATGFNQIKFTLKQSK